MAYHPEDYQADGSRFCIDAILAGVCLFLMGALSIDLAPSRHDVRLAVADEIPSHVINDCI